MNEPILTSRVEVGEDGRIRVLTPRLGMWSGHPAPGALMGPGARAGILEHLNRRFVLVLPEGVRGRLTGTLPRDRVVAVEYGELLFELAPLRADDADDGDHAGTERVSPAGEAALPTGSHAVTAPTDGVFYRAPRPGAEPFVQPGQGVAAGQALGLVEVMKTFNQILYGGPGLPETAEVVEIRCADGEEIRAGQILVVVR